MNAGELSNYIWIVTVLLIILYFAVLSYKTKKDHKRFTKSIWEPYFFIAPVVLVLLLMYGSPLIESITMSMLSYKLTKLDHILWNQFENFRSIFSDPDVLKVTINTFVYVIVSVLLQFLLGMTLALALRKKFRGRNLYQAFVFLPWAFSAFVVGLMFRWSFNGEYGVVNDLLLKLGLIKERIAWLGTPGLSLLVVIVAMVWIGIPFFAMMILAALQSIPQDIYEAASIDGASRIKQFFSITIPYIKPTIIMTLLLRTIWVFNSFDLIVVITGGGPASSSQTLPGYMYSKAFSSLDFGMASAMGVIIMIALTLYAIFFMYVTKYGKASDF